MDDNDLKALHDKAVMVLNLHNRAKYGYYKMKVLAELAQGVIDLEQEVQNSQLQIKSLERIIDQETKKAQTIIDSILEGDKHGFTLDRERS